MYYLCIFVLIPFVVGYNRVYYGRTKISFAHRASIDSESNAAMASTSSSSSSSNSNILVNSTSDMVISPSNNSDSFSITRPNAPTNVGPLLTQLVETMPAADKYTFLIQSYASTIKDSTLAKNNTLMDMIENLCTEMITKSLPPNKRTIRYMIDAAASFSSSSRLGKTLQLGKAGGTLKAFGLSVSQLTSPLYSATNTRFMSSNKIPQDDRDVQIISFGAVTSFSALWVLLEIIGRFDSDVHPWATLLGCAGALVGFYDLSINKGAWFQNVLGGFDRLALRDSEREAFCDSSTLLSGYLLGLPCFCYQPEVVEALKLLRDNPAALDAFKQPRAIILKKKAAKSASTASNNIFDAFFKPGKLLPSSDAAVVEETKDITGENESFQLTSSINNDKEEIALNLGRLLVWLYTPVAAEALKYGGKTIVSDPRAGSRLLSVLSDIQEEQRKKVSNETDSSATDKIIYYPVPAKAEDRQALLQWAYYEAETLIKLYNDLLEDISTALLKKKLTVGECALLIEKELVD